MVKYLWIFLFFSFSSFSQKEYYKKYHSNGNLKEEGWLLSNEKTDYWYFYDANGNKIQEGHFKNNQKIKWWIFYDSDQKTIKKCEFLKDKMNGLCLIYTNLKIAKAEKYNNGKLIKSWTDLSEFKKDNNI